jgi:polyferredoxin
MQYHLRTLLIVLAVGPALLAGMWFGVVVSVLSFGRFTFGWSRPK